MEVEPLLTILPGSTVDSGAVGASASPPSSSGALSRAGRSDSASASSLSKVSPAPFYTTVLTMALVDALIAAHSSAACAIHKQLLNVAAV